MKKLFYIFFALNISVCLSANANTQQPNKCPDDKDLSLTDPWELCYGNVLYADNDAFIDTIKANLYPHYFESEFDANISSRIDAIEKRFGELAFSASSYNNYNPLCINEMPDIAADMLKRKQCDDNGNCTYKKTILLEPTFTNPETGAEYEKTKCFDIDLLKAFNEASQNANLPYAIVVAPKYQDPATDPILERTKEKQFFDNNCSYTKVSFNPLMGIRDTPIHAAARFAFEKDYASDYTFFLDFGDGDNNRIFPGLLLGDEDVARDEDPVALKKGYDDALAHFNRFTACLTHQKPTDQNFDFKKYEWDESDCHPCKPFKGHTLYAYLVMPISTDAACKALKENIYTSSSDTRNDTGWFGAGAGAALVGAGGMALAIKAGAFSGAAIGGPLGTIIGGAAGALLTGFVWLFSPNSLKDDYHMACGIIVANPVKITE